MRNLQKTFILTRTLSLSSPSHDFSIDSSSPTIFFCRCFFLVIEVAASHSPFPFLFIAGFLCAPTETCKKQALEIKSDTQNFSQQVFTALSIKNDREPLQMPFGKNLMCSENVRLIFQWQNILVSSLDVVGFLQNL